MPTNKLQSKSKELIVIFLSLTKSERLDFLQMFMRSHTSEEYKAIIETLGEHYDNCIPRA